MLQKKSILLSAVWSYGNIIFKGVSSLFIVFIFSRFIDVTEYGYFVSAILIIELLAYFGEIGISPFIIQRSKIDEKIIAISFTVTFTISLLLIFFINLAILTLNNFGIFSESFVILKYMSFQILSKNLLVIMNSKWFRELNNEIITKISITSGSISFLIGLTALLFLDPLYALILYTLSKSWLQLFFSWRIKNYRLYFFFDPNLIKEIINFGSPLIFSRLISYINIQAPKLICWFFLGPYYLGILSAAILITNNLHKICCGSNWSLWMPFLSKVRRTYPKRFGEMYLRIRNIQSAAIIPILLLIISLKKQIILIVVPEKFYEIENLLVILCLSGIFVATNYLFKPTLVMLGKTKQRLFFDVINLTLYLSLLPLLSKNDLVSFVYGVFFVELMFFLICQFHLKTMLKINILSQLSSLKGILSASCSILVINYIFNLYLLGLNKWIYLLNFIIISTLLYTSILYFTDRKVFRELLNFKEIFLSETL